jgi:hypothetical protein
MSNVKFNVANLTDSEIMDIIHERGLSCIFYIVYYVSLISFWHFIFATHTPATSEPLPAISSMTKKISLNNFSDIFFNMKPPVFDNLTGAPDN